jgi:hypothetical protein
MTELINDAVAYGVRVVEVEVEPGVEYWKIARVHHLTPEENYGRHHIFLDALDEAGNRLFGSRALVRWDGGSEKIVVDKPLGEPGTNFPLWKWQICSLEMLDLPSDRVDNLRTDHPDEASGNSLFHHSFSVTVQRTVAPMTDPLADSVISGRVFGGRGHTLILRGEVGNERILEVGDSEVYRFEHLGAGRYTIEDLNDSRIVGPVEVDGSSWVEIDFPPIVTNQPLNRYLLLGYPSNPLTQLHLSLIADYVSEQGFAFGFTVEQAIRAVHVTLVGDHPDETRILLQTAGCLVDDLPADPSALVTALKTS